MTVLTINSLSAQLREMATQGAALLNLLRSKSLCEALQLLIGCRSSQISFSCPRQVHEVPQGETGLEIEVRISLHVTEQMLFHLNHSSTGLPHHGSLLISSS